MCVRKKLLGKYTRAQLTSVVAVKKVGLIDLRGSERFTRKGSVFFLQLVIMKSSFHAFIRDASKTHSQSENINEIFKKTHKGGGKPLIKTLCLNAKFAHVKLFRFELSFVNEMKKSKSASSRIFSWMCHF